jgi:hypothetical protein
MGNMADKLDWMNKHLVLLRYVLARDLVEKENYKIRPDLEDCFSADISAEKVAFRLAGDGKYKDACELVAYMAHRRAGVWWGYRCVLSLLEELMQNPPENRDIEDIGLDFNPRVPDFAQIELPKPDPDVIAAVSDTQAQAQAKIDELSAQADQEMLSLVREGVETAFQEFKRQHGIHPLDLLKQLGQQALSDTPFQIDPNSPIFKAVDELKAQLQGIKRETVDTIKSVLPPKVPEHEKKMRDNAMAAVYRWIVAPDEENSKACLDIGNECPDTPAGLLALSAFWAFGNLMPGSEQVVPTPPGLAANGLVQVLLMCGLHKGGTRKLKERYELYFNLGVDVLIGRDNWEASLAQEKAPHDTISGVASASSKPTAGTSAYKRWKPE